MEIVNFAKENGETKTIEKYLCTLPSIRRWSKLFDGTVESLKDNHFPPYLPNPNPHTPEETKIIKKLLCENPYIPYSDLHRILKKDYGYSRNIGSLYDFLRRENIISKHNYKNNFATLFDKEALYGLNEKFLYNNKKDMPQYLVELDNNGIFIARYNFSGVCKLTVYYSDALKFPNEEYALNFINSLNNTSSHTLAIKKIDCPEICESLLE